MADGKKGRRSFVETVKAPLIFSAVLGLVAGFVATIAASGGTENSPRVDLGLIAFGIAFIAALLIVSMLQLASRENPEELSQGAGVNRNSEELYRQQVAKRREEARRKEAERAREAGEEPKYGRRQDD